MYVFLQKLHQSFFSIATFIDSKDSWGLFASVQESARKDGNLKLETFFVWTICIKTIDE